MPSRLRKAFPPIENAEVAKVFDRYPPNVRDALLDLRAMIFATARDTPGVGELTETLRWGQPSYLTKQTKSGSIVRLDQIKSHAGRYGLFFHCQTTLVDTMRERFRGLFKFDGNRCLYFDSEDVLHRRELSDCIAMALTYHNAKAKHK